MARKPIHLQAVGKLTPRDRIWAAVRASSGVPFTADNVARHVVNHAPANAAVKRIPERTIMTYLLSLTRAEYLEATHGESSRHTDGAVVFPPTSYRLIRDCGVEAPRIKVNGMPVTQGAGREALWRTMKILKFFTRSDLARAASTASCVVSERDAMCYLQFLCKAGYVAVHVASKPGTQTLWRFVAAKNTGPRAPMIQRVKHVYDPNLGEVVWHPEVHS